MIPIKDKISNNLKALDSNLSKPYPFYYQGKSLVSTIVSLYLLTWIFVAVFQPFETNSETHKFNYFWIIGIQALILAGMIVPLSSIATKLKLHINWNIYREMMLLSINFFLVSIALFLSRELVYKAAINWTWELFFVDIVHTFLVGSLIMLFISFMNNHLFKSRNKNNTESIDQNHKDQQSQLIKIETQIKSETFHFSINEFLFAKSVGNYTEIYLQQQKVVKVLKRIPLKELALNLVEYKNIVRSHRSYIVNLNHIKNMSGNAQAYKLHFLNCPESVPVSRSYAQFFKESLVDS